MSPAIVSVAALPAASVSFTSPSFDYWALTPLFLVFGGACVAVLVEAFAPRRLRLPLQLGVSLTAVILALVVVTRLAVQEVSVETAGVGVGAGSVVIDGPTLFVQATILALSVLTLLLMSERSDDSGRRVHRAGLAGPRFDR